LNEERLNDRKITGRKIARSQAILDCHVDRLSEVSEQDPCDIMQRILAGPGADCMVNGRGTCRTFW